MDPVTDDFFEKIDFAALFRKYGREYRDRILNDHIKNLVAERYGITEKELLKSNKTEPSEARTICYSLLRAYSNPRLGYKRIAKMYGLASHSSVETKVGDMNHFLQNPTRHKRLVDCHNFLLEEVEVFADHLNRQVIKTQNKPELIEVPENNNNMAKVNEDNPLNEGNEEFLQVPGVDDSPLSDPVIDRNVGKGFTALLNEKNISEAKIAEEKVDNNNADQKANENPKNEMNGGSSPSFMDDSDIEEEDNAEDYEEETYEDVGSMKFDIPKEGDGQGFDLPPEAAAFATDFSSNSIIDMVNLILPDTVAEFIQIDEDKVSQILSDAPGNVKNKGVNEVRRLNKENLGEIRRKVRSITPYMAKPLRETLSVHKLTVSPTAVLVVLSLWLGVSLYLMCTRMSKRCKSLVEELEAMMERHRPTPQPEMNITDNQVPLKEAA